MKLDKNAQTALRWIQKHMNYSDFYDDESTNEEMMEWYAYEISLFARNLAPKTPISVFINRNYGVQTFFLDHEHTASRFYGR